MEHQTSQTETIVFDTASGISLEEQEEILAGINAMTGSRLVPKTTVTRAKKKGFLFPLYVNIGAFALLLLGFMLLFFLHGHDEQQIRDSSSLLGNTERILIQQIRQETNRQINEKDNEINNILSKLSAVDSEYQEEYNILLTYLMEERAGILEDSRLREAAIRTHAEERTSLGIEQ
ncbi:MAG: hypothetical protein LBH42_04470, partial [Treponema sp.]|nr:hypothetical protein [Treponema sp.]